MRIQKDTIEKLIAHIYACTAICLHEKGWGYKRLNDLFLATQKMYETTDVFEMCKLCEDITGICCMTEKMAEEAEYNDNLRKNQVNE